MNKKGYVAGMVVGILILLMAVPLGKLYGAFCCLTFSEAMVEGYLNMLSQSSIVTFQIIGTLIAGISGIAFVFTKKDR